MNKPFFSGLQITALVLSTFSAAAVVASPNEGTTPVVLTYTDHQPLEGMRTQFLNNVLFPAIERESEGRIKIDAHWDGEIAKAYAGMGTVAEGKAADFGVVVPEYTAKELPIHQIFKSFPIGPSGSAQVETFRQIYQTLPVFTQELAKNNLTPVFLSTGYPAGFFATQPIASVDSIQQQKWRSASFWHLDFIKRLGAEPVRMHWGPEVYTALDNGDLDGILVNIDSAYNLDLHKTAPHALVSDKLWLGHLYIIAMNQQTYHALSEDNRQAIQRAAEYAYTQLGQVMDNHYHTMLDQLTLEGATVREMSPDELTALKQQTGYQEIQSSWAKTQQEQDVLAAQETIDAVAAILEEIDQ